MHKFFILFYGFKNLLNVFCIYVDFVETEKASKNEESNSFNDIYFLGSVHCMYTSVHDEFKQNVHSVHDEFKQTVHFCTWWV